MKRRTLITAIPIGLAGTTFSLSYPSLMAAIAGEKHEEWGYNNSEHWGDLAQEYAACKVGNQQSPIDLGLAINSELQPIEFFYQDIPLRLSNNGHTIQVNSNPGNYIMLDNTKFELLQFHFHHPSEHTITGETYPMEIHFVHKNEQGLLAVVGVFLKEGAENKILEPIWKAMPYHKSSEKIIKEVALSLTEILPTNSPSYRYFGSLTTPPCSEIVNWVIFQEPIEISSAQINQFRQIFPLNARPIQPINRRFLLTSI